LLECGAPRLLVRFGGSYVGKPLESALTRLKLEKQRIDRQIAAIEGALKLNGAQLEKEGRRSARPGRKPMSPAERRAVSRRMKT